MENKDYNYNNKFKSSFKELNRVKISEDKSIVISLKTNNLTGDERISIAQGVKIIPKGSKTGELVEIFYQNALTLKVNQAKELIQKLQGEIYNIEKSTK